MKQIKNYIAITTLILGFSISVYAQKGVVETNITGTVTASATGKPVSGAKITIPEVTSQLTDDNGEFKLTKTVKDAYIDVVAPGFASQRIYLNNKSEIKILLLDDSYKGNSHEILLPFTAKNLMEYAGAAATHENRDDYKTGSSSVEKLLEGRFGGLNVKPRSGAPGSGVNLFLNGLNTLSINSQPLIVVDGIIYDNQPIFSLISGNQTTALTDIDVKDIDNITVLKDGTSMYGAKGSNGVILINTLKVKETATRINLYAYTGVNFEPVNTYKMMGADNYKNYLMEMSANAGMGINQINALPYFNTVKPIVENWGTSGNADYYRYNQSTDWQNEVLNSSFNQNYHLNVTGGNDKSLIAVSVGYLGQKGDVKNTSYERYSTRINADIKMTDWFKLKTNLSFIYSQRMLAFEGLNKNFNPIYASLVKSPFTSPYVYNVLGEKTPNNENVDIFGISNPLVLTQYSSSNERFRFFGNINGNITFTKYLTGDVIFGLTSDVVTKEKVFMPSYGVNHEILASGVVTNESQQLRNLLGIVNVDSKLNYERTFNYVNSLSAHLGFRYQSGTSELDWGKANNTSSDQMQTLGDGLNTLAEMGGNLGEWSSICNYLSADYSYRNKYYLMLNAALDGSSRYGANADGVKLFNHVFGFFPSINGAWVISAEDFMQTQHVVDFLKLRAGYTITGNDDIGNYSSKLYYSPQVLLGAYGLISGNIPNSTLKWETNKRVSLGFEASLLQQRLNLSVDLYNSMTTDLIKTKKVATMTGFSSALTNDGSLINNGVDITINGRLIDNSDLKFDLGLNISTYKNTLLSSSTDEDFYSIYGGVVRSKVGSSIGQFYGYQTNGILKTANEATAENLNIQKADGTLIPFTAGDVRFVDKDNNHIIDSKDMTVIGDANPDFFGSIIAKLKWKQFTLDALVSYSSGNDIYNALRANLESMSGTDNQTIAAINRWRTDGQNTSMPKLAYGDPMGNARFSDRWIEDGSFIRLKTITLAYDINVKSTIISSAQAYITGNNLLTLTRYLGYDPEFSVSQNPLSAGIDNCISPMQRTILVGVKIGL